GCPEPAPGPPIAPTAPLVPPPLTNDAGAIATEPPPAPKPAEQFAAECKSHIDGAKTLVDQILGVKDARAVANTLEPYNGVLIHVTNAISKASLLSEVHPDPEYRAAAQKCVEDV